VPIWAGGETLSELLRWNLDLCSGRPRVVEVRMSSPRIAAALVVLVLTVAACSDADQATEVSAVVAPHFSQEGLATGDPVPGATLRLYQDDTVILETALDDGGMARIAPEPGTYDLQIESATSDPFCFWGDTVFDVALPSALITVEVGFICTGQ
jgi:hypothetical protein